jgi:hypothetical protein
VKPWSIASFFKANLQLISRKLHSLGKKNAESTLAYTQLVGGTTLNPWSATGLNLIDNRAVGVRRPCGSSDDVLAETVNTEVRVSGSPRTAELPIMFRHLD